MWVFIIGFGSIMVGFILRMFLGLPDVPEPPDAATLSTIEKIFPPTS